MNTNETRAPLEKQGTPFPWRRWEKTVPVVLLILLLIAAVFKYVVYFLPERVSFDKGAVLIEQVQPDLESLYVMPFNGELTVANQQYLFASSKDKTVAMDFLSPTSNQVLVRAEVFTDMDNLNKKPSKKFWTRLLAPKDERMVRIGATGWVRPGEMVQSLELDELPCRSCDATVRFSAVNPANTKSSP